MDAEIQALISNNAAPSEKAKHEIKALELKNLQDLDKLDSEIVILENRLQELRSKRDTTRRKIHQYRSILSSLRRMPPEVLAEIFCRCFPTHRNPLIAPTECPLLLTQVCSFWRAAAISEPRLWERIYITFSESIQEYGRHSAQHTNKILRRRLKAIKRWIGRSGTRPLSISICFTTAWCYFFTLSQAYNFVVWEFFKYIASLSSRFKSLELKMPLSVYLIFQPMIDTAGMTQLTSLRADLPDYEDSEGVLDPIALFMAPNLNTISISTNNPSLWGIMDPRHLSVWSRLTDFSFHSTLRSTMFRTALTPTKLLFLLQHSPNLVHFKAVLCEANDDDSATQGSQRISLPFLRTFSIKDEVPPYERENLGLYARIDAPGITWVEYGGTLESQDHDGNEADCSIVALLERLPALKKLTINCEYLDECPSYECIDLLGSILKAVPSITHLFIGCEERSPSGRLVRYPPNYTSPLWRRRVILGLPLYDLIGIRTRNTRYSEPGSASGDSDPPLLPNLTSLEIASSVMDFTAEDLIKVVVSRIKPALPLCSSSLIGGSSSGIARLKHVGVVFYLEQRLDIAAKIRQYAERVGADMIDLFLDYLERPEPRMSHLAPEYGLNTLNGRSWDYKDPEDFEDDRQ